jgi:magnesium chelatase subunit I
MKDIKTLGELKASGYQPRSIKEELRSNLINHLKKGGKSDFSQPQY